MSLRNRVPTWYTFRRQTISLRASSCPSSGAWSLFEWANRARKRYIIEDDYDSEFRYSGRLIMPLFADDASDKVIYLNAFSKTMVPSLRISYMVLPPKLLARYVDTMSFVFVHGFQFLNSTHWLASSTRVTWSGTSTARATSIAANARRFCAR